MLLECPNTECKKIHPVFRDFNKMLKTKLATLIFYCPECPPQQQIFRYDDIIKHLQSECPNRRLACPNRYCNETKGVNDLLRHLKACPKTQVKCKSCVINMNQENAPAHNCSALLTDRLQKKDKEVKDLKDLLAKVSNNFDKVFTLYYPKEYVPKEDDTKRAVSAYDFFRKEKYPEIKLKNPGKL